MKYKKIKKAIISVSNKSNLKLILKILKKFKIQIISSGGTYKKIKEMNYKCEEVSDYTGFNEMLDGRVKTLHPKIHAGILNIRNSQKHKIDLIKNNIDNIDLVIVDLYPFEKKLKEKKNFDELVEFIDIGGSALLRGAAKNFNDVVVISNPSDYSELIKELKSNKGYTSYNFRKKMSSKAFNLTSYYDSIIAGWLNDNLKINFPEKITIHGSLIKKLRYGENPHQEGYLYGSFDNNFNKIHGKELSYNNYNDIYTTLEILNSFKKEKCVTIVKHANPCGVSIGKNLIYLFKKAFKCDPVSAFGGVIGFNSIISKKVALEINKIFFEVIIAKGFSKDALKILKRKKNLRLIDYKNYNFNNTKHYQFYGNSFLSQDINNKLIDKKKLKIVSKIKPSANQMRNLKFAFNICKFVKSNAIVLANDKSTIGIGSGQPSRVDSCKIASNKAFQFLPEKINNSVAASDAFFPFPDGIYELVNAGVKAIIQPGGSINDRKVIEAANKAGISMVFTGIRHFKH